MGRLVVHGNSQTHLGLASHVESALAIGEQGELTVGEIAARFDGVGRTAVSSRLRILRLAGLITERRDGRYRHYSLTSTLADTVVAYLASVYQNPLDQLCAALTEAVEAAGKRGPARRAEHLTAPAWLSSFSAARPAWRHARANCSARVIHRSAGCSVPRRNLSGPVLAAIGECCTDHIVSSFVGQDHVRFESQFSASSPAHSSPACARRASAARGAAVVAVVGRNGAGKTTLVKTAAGVLRATAGELLLDGTEITRLPPSGRAAQHAGTLSGGERHLSLAMHLADRFIVLSKGEVIDAGTADDAELTGRLVHHLAI